tara:strand:- start:74 stop:691 length:618 start_codon:yes stop_codon:yes gene_type:complete
MKHVLKVVLLNFFLLVSFVGSAYAQEDPDTLVKKTIEDILETVRNDPDVQAGKIGRIKEIMEDKVAPHIDFPRMTRLAVGRSWRDATKEQKKALVREFHELLMRSYAAAFKMYQGIVVETRSLPRVEPEEKQVTVNTLVRLPGGAPPLSVDYDLLRSGESWKVYDVRVDGASLVINYRSVFAQEIQKGGLDGLLKALAVKNKPGQ